MELGLRLLQFFNFVFVQGWEGGICWHEKEFHVTITGDGNIYSYGQQPTLSAALDECLSGLKKVGF